MRSRNYHTVKEVTADQSKKKKVRSSTLKKKTGFPLLTHIHFLSYTLERGGKCTRTEIHSRLKQNRNFSAGYLKNAYTLRKKGLFENL